MTTTTFTEPQTRLSLNLRRLSRQCLLAWDTAIPERQRQGFADVIRSWALARTLSALLHADVPQERYREISSEVHEYLQREEWRSLHHLCIELHEELVGPWE